MADVAEPGDFLILSTPDRLTAEQAHTLKERVKAMLPQLGDVLIASQISQITVVKAAGGEPPLETRDS